MRGAVALLQERDGLPSKREMEAWGERCRPHRSVASWYPRRSLEIETPA